MLHAALEARCCCVLWVSGFTLHAVVVARFCLCSDSLAIEGRGDRLATAAVQITTVKVQAPIFFFQSPGCASLLFLKAIFSIDCLFF